MIGSAGIVSRETEKALDARIRRVIGKARPELFAVDYLPNGTAEIFLETRKHFTPALAEIVASDLRAQGFVCGVEVGLGTLAKHTPEHVFVTVADPAPRTEPTS